MAAILKILKYEAQLHFDLRYEKIIPNYAMKRIFHGDDVVDDVTGWPQNIDVDIAISKFDLLCDLMTSSMTSSIQIKVKELLLCNIHIYSKAPEPAWLHT